MLKQTLLEQMESAGCLIDIDSYEPDFVKAMPFKPHDATCNTFILGAMVQDLRNREVVKEVIQKSKSLSAGEIFIKLHADFASRILPLLSGRVFAQVSSKSANDVEGIVKYAEALTKAYEEAGIGKDRLCIKIPANTAGVKAAVTLREKGIQTLGTAVFGAHQAIAASQAGMYAISPYFNAIVAFQDVAYWPDVEEPGKNHPMASRSRAIRAAFDKLASETGKRQPELKAAGQMTGREVFAQVELGADHVTVMPPSISDLLAFTELPTYRKGERDHRISSSADLPPQISSTQEISSDDPLKFIPDDGTVEWPYPNYLDSDNLDKAIEADPIAKARLANALAFFEEAEDKVVEFIDEIRATLA